MKKALITGVTGQDGFFLTKWLLNKGYEVHGLVRKSEATLGTLELLPAEVKETLHLYWGELTDNEFLTELIRAQQFSEIYHLAAQSFVGKSFSDPGMTYSTNIGGTTLLANAVKEFSPSSRCFFALTAELFGGAGVDPQNEETPMITTSPYGASKLANYWLSKTYREHYGLFISSGFLFNHESEMRGENFVTMKIAKAVAKIHKNLQDKLVLGNLDAKRDWGHASDYVEAMYLMLQQEAADDFVLATGETHSIRDFVDQAFQCIDVSIDWRGEGVETKGIDTQSGRTLIEVSPEFFRPVDVAALRGNSSKARSVLGWRPRVDFSELVEKMVRSQLDIITA